LRRRPRAKILLPCSPTPHDSAAGEQVIAVGFGRERKVRTPPGSMPRKTRGSVSRKRGATESVTENIPPAVSAREPQVRVKRRGKSPPPGAQAPGHDKPHAVQDITGSTTRLGRPAQVGQLPGNSRISAAARRTAIRASGSREMIITAAGNRGGTEFGLSLTKMKAPSARGAPSHCGTALGFSGENSRRAAARHARC